MERNKNKIIHIFQTEGTLTPPGEGMVMNSQFEDWFLDWTIENDYCLLTYGDIKDCRTHIPHSVLNKAKYVFSDNGTSVNRYAGLNWIKKIGDVKVLAKSGDIIDYLTSEEGYETCYLFSHNCSTEDKSMAERLHSMHKCEVFQIDEWKDTALYMKRLVWEKK